MRDSKSVIYHPKQEEEQLPLLQMEGFPGNGVGTLPLYIPTLLLPKGSDLPKGYQSDLPK